jgi:hypothetical protein
VVGLFAVALAVAVGARGCNHDESITPPRAVPGTASTSRAGVQHTLDRLVEAVRADDDQQAEGLGVSGSSLVGDIITNARVLGIRDFRLRDVDDDTDPAAGSAIRDRFGPDTWVDSVQVSYRLPQDVGPTTMESNFAFVPGPSGSARIAAVGTSGERGALWLEGPIQVRKTARILLIAATNQSMSRYWKLAQRAVRDVDAVLGARRGALVFEVPSDQQQLEQLIDASAGTYKLIAGVTASVDGSVTRHSAIHSFFNPNLMSHQGHRGSQLVVSHEATLQATRAPVSPMPIWMEEGFADYVGLAHAGVPLRVSAKEIATQVRKSGPPAALPTQADFAYTQTNLNDLNAVYESAWLACRYIADRWGEATLLVAYRAFDQGTAPGSVFREVLGLDERHFVGAWRRYLVSIAAKMAGR